MDFAIGEEVICGVTTDNRIVWNKAISLYKEKEVIFPVIGYKLDTNTRILAVGATYKGWKLYSEHCIRYNIDPAHAQNLVWSISVEYLKTKIVGKKCQKCERKFNNLLPEQDFLCWECSL